jgi:hypothetical protein
LVSYLFGVKLDALWRWRGSALVLRGAIAPADFDRTVERGFS